MFNFGLNNFPTLVLENNLEFNCKLHRQSIVANNPNSAHFVSPMCARFLFFAHNTEYLCPHC